MYLELNHLKKSFDSTEALKDASLSVEKGEFVSVIGPSGSGKTTLFRILNGAIKADSGEFLLNGRDFMKASRKEFRKLQRQIGTIYQDFCLVESVSCLQNVLNACLPEMNFFTAAFGFFGKKRIAEAEMFLQKVGLGEKIHEPVKNLSGGQKQRVAIARALMCHPVLLLADEPVASLDPVTGRQILDLLKELRDSEGLTILMNSHNLQLSLEYSQKLVGLHNGCTVFSGTPEETTEEILTEIYGSSAELSLNEQRNTAVSSPNEQPVSEQPSKE